MNMTVSVRHENGSPPKKATVTFMCKFKNKLN